MRDIESLESVGSELKHRYQSFYEKIIFPETIWCYLLVALLKNTPLFFS